MKSFSTVALLSFAAMTAALALTFGLSLSDTVRSAALLGVALSGASGGLALMLKRRALNKAGIRAALSALVFMFAVRGVLLAIGLWAVLRNDGAELAFVFGFFGVYLVQQTLEFLWVVAASKGFKGAPAT